VDLITILNEIFNAIEDNQPAKARMACNRALAFLAPINQPYARRFEGVISHTQFILKTKWYINTAQHLTLMDIDSLICECETQNRRMA